MRSERENLTIGAFAKAAGVNVETIRYYQRRGLLPQPPRPPGSVRRYCGNDIDRVHFVKSAQQLGFSLDEIEHLLKLEDGMHCAEAKSMAENRLADVRARLEHLRLMEQVLADMVRRCHSNRGTITCPVIASLKTSH